MKVFDDNFKLDNTVKFMSDLKLEDYATMSDKTTDQIFVLSKGPARQLYNALGLKSSQFMKSLYTVDRDIWKELVDKKLGYEDSKVFMAGNKAIVVDGEIVSITPDTGLLNKFIDICKTVFSDYKEVYYEFDEDDKVLSIVGLTEDNIGLLAKYYMPSTYVEIYEVFKDTSGLLNISPFKIVNSEVTGDDIEIVMNIESLNVELSSFQDRDTRKDYNERLCCPMSVEELTYYTKKYLKYKLTSDYDFDPTYLSDKLDLSYETTVALDHLAGKINNIDVEILNTYYSNYLKKSITMTDITFGELADVLYGLIMDGELKLKVLVWVFNDLMRSKCHYLYINN